MSLFTRILFVLLGLFITDTAGGDLVIKAIQHPSARCRCGKLDNDIIGFSVTYSNVVVLDSDMDTIGEITKIAPDLVILNRFGQNRLLQFPPFRYYTISQLFPRGPQPPYMIS